MPQQTSTFEACSWVPILQVGGLGKVRAKLLSQDPPLTDLQYSESTYPTWPVAVTKPLLTYPRLGLDNFQPGFKESPYKKPLELLWSSSRWKKRFENRSTLPGVSNSKRCKLSDNHGPSCVDCEEGSIITYHCEFFKLCMYMVFVSLQ
ncbi:hypothetical protein ElyMa_005067400 [Elysia marginata]|uniref:Uncharacterized protein n=1 Tax=Elysia marginata TaxID=1093978 RepID=A0AAV4JDI3_9GAST|nr:hypothetical protein ElyMa_005067400 [Elysia marginata]